MAITPEVLSLYESLVATVPGVERRGAAMPYTAVNGNMFSFLTPDGALALRLPDGDRTAFLAEYSTSLCEQHGRVMTEYVVVPDALLRSTDSLAPHFARSYSYATSLKPKPSRKR